MKTGIFTSNDEAYVIKKIHELGFHNHDIDGLKNFTYFVAKLHGLPNDKDYILNMSKNELEEHDWSI